jgi:hypothetical protein
MIALKQRGPEGFQPEGFQPGGFQTNKAEGKEAGRWKRATDCVCLKEGNLKII